MHKSFCECFYITLPGAAVDDKVLEEELEDENVGVVSGFDEDVNVPVIVDSVEVAVLLPVFPTVLDRLVSVTAV